MYGGEFPCCHSEFSAFCAAEVVIWPNLLRSRHVVNQKYEFCNCLQFGVIICQLKKLISFNEIFVCCYGNAIRPSVCLSVCMYVCLSVRLSIFLSQLWCVERHWLYQSFKACLKAYILSSIGKSKFGQHGSSPTPLNFEAEQSHTSTNIGLYS